MTNPEGSRPNPENLPSKERPIFLTDAITLSGYGGAGKTVIGGMLARHLNLLFIKPSGPLREKVRQNTGKGLLGFSERTVEEDIAFNKNVENELQASMNNGKRFIEARLAGWIAKKMENAAKKEDLPYPKTAKILFITDQDVRDLRTFNREKKENPNLTLEEVKKANREREEGDNKAWAKADPTLTGKDPMGDPNLTDENGDPVYDIVINTTNLSLYQLVIATYRELVIKGFIKIEDNTRLLQSGQIFPTPNA